MNAATKGGDAECVGRNHLVHVMMSFRQSAIAVAGAGIIPVGEGGAVAAAAVPPPPDPPAPTPMSTRRAPHANNGDGQTRLVPPPSPAASQRWCRSCGLGGWDVYGEDARLAAEPVRAARNHTLIPRIAPKVSAALFVLEHRTDACPACRTKGCDIIHVAAASRRRTSLSSGGDRGGRRL